MAFLTLRFPCFALIDAISYLSVTRQNACTEMRTAHVRLKSKSRRSDGGSPRIVNNNYELTCRAKAAPGD